MFKIVSLIAVGALLLLSVACSPQQKSNSNELPDALKGLGQTTLASGQQMLQQGQQILNGPQPHLLRELPDVGILSNPRNLVGLSVAAFPRTYVFEASLNNDGKTWPVIWHSWKIEQVGIPLIAQDREIFSGNGKQISFTFQERSVYRVTLTVRTIANQLASSTVLLMPNS